MTFAQSLFIAAPAFAILALVEFFVGHAVKKNVYANLLDVASSLSSAMCNVLAIGLGISFSIVSYAWMLENFAVFSFDDLGSPLVWFALIVCIDFYSYWVHRFNHKFNILWQLHMIHHSSEEFNLPVALRQPIFNVMIKLFSFLLLPMAILGAPEEVTAVVGLVFLFYQYWYHTQLIGNLGWLERIIVTPEQHSIHHAMNPEYIDKNFGGWFSIWDQMFGTFQPKIEGVEPVFGLTRPVRTWNPVKIEMMHWKIMIKDFFNAGSLKDKLYLLISPTNWQPADATSVLPQDKIADVYNFQKYTTNISMPVFFLIPVEMMVTFGLIILTFIGLDNFDNMERVACAIAIYCNIIVYTTVLEGNKALLLQVSRILVFAFGAFILGVNWFGMNEIHHLIAPIISVFFCVSTFISYFFTPEQEVLSAVSDHPNHHVLD